MTGLDKILKAIEAEAEAKADKVISEANKEAEEILSAAKAEAEKRCKEIAEKSEADKKAILSRAESAAALQEKKILLDVKQQIISNIIDNARMSLANLPDSELIEIVLQMVKRYAHNKEGQIVFSASDKNRIPKDFNNSLKAVLEDRPGAVLTVSDETASIDGGFLLVYGDVEENCSFDALFNAYKETLQDQVNALLFD
ncbi:hypothetical protein H0486_09780 [Lachnospiraceae bacterium MD1]|uniref:V-type proton ATPase subunit E n=1 Tax=Variimorphobacter saccharofermentans TaxID=2755051 RepID=A0A839K168_9FIRM|nr:V-type ATP synthase subunit E [Variimorphobacter saccharofermentans]MBB2183167.1 hypothetical protein [Variimorphobacter saccharofermentans]